MHKLAVNQLYKSFSGKPVLRGISLSVEIGKTMVLLGSSGSGKSTLLRCINLLETPDSGTLQVDKTSLHFPKTQENKSHYATAIKEIRKKVGMVFQQFHLWPHLTVLENVTQAPIHVLKQSPTKATVAATEVLTTLGIADKAQHYPAQLSGGQQQRVAIARTLMMEPEFILFDEPNSGLDPEKSRAIAGIIRSLANKGITQIISTHDIPFALEVADAILFLEEGQILEVATVVNKHIFPQHPRFQAFLSLPPTPLHPVDKESIE
ncbi:MAG: Octopine permease ATP-binding protein [Pseudomonadota bacterium]|jgi:ABC-type polar amino acid transport system ATPase subunit